MQGIEIGVSSNGKLTDKEGKREADVPTLLQRDLQ